MSHWPPYSSAHSYTTHEAISSATLPSLPDAPAGVSHRDFEGQSSATSGGDEISFEPGFSLSEYHEVGGVYSLPAEPNPAGIAAQSPLLGSLSAKPSLSRLASLSRAVILYDSIANFFRANPGRGFTAKQIAAHAGIDVNEAQKKIHYLKSGQKRLHRDVNITITHNFGMRHQPGESNLYTHYDNAR